MIDKNKTTLILGAYGRVGKPLVDLMDKAGYNILFPTHLQCDLLNSYSYEAYFNLHKPSYIINLIAKTTNINLCNHYPASICRDTLLMNMNALEMCKKYKVEKLVNVICSCAYPHNKEELLETEFWDGSPHDSVMAHGLSKRTIYYLGQAYVKEKNMNVITIALNNVFGGASWEHPTSLKFLDGLIVRVVDAKLNKHKDIYPWGNGYVRRESIYNKDAAAGILKSFETYDDPELINIGTGVDYNIREWLDIIIGVVKWKGVVHWQSNKEDGQQKKLFNVDKMKNILQWQPCTDIRQAIEETIIDYKTYKENCND